ncbi:MAG TPA: hypothetical protein VNW71_09140 [Thermoanaerobaculia bacterium]|nr:hypothetical protein [Thermoanaerobaculia bacterium]
MGETRLSIDVSSKLLAGILKDCPEAPICSGISRKPCSATVMSFAERLKAVLFKAKGFDVEGKGKEEGARVNAPLG